MIATTPVAQLAVGDEAPVFEHELTRADLIRYAGASGDFFPLHTDDAFAREAGLPGIFAHGMYSAGLLATAVTNWLGIGTLRRFKVRFAAKAWPGELLRSRVIVVGMRVEGGVHLVDFDCRLSNSSGEVKVLGSGTASADRGRSSTSSTEDATQP